MNPIVSFLRWKQTSDYKKRCAENPYDYHTAMWADIPYICDGSPDHTLDVYAPDDTRTPRPVIFEMHGGGYLACFKEVNRQHGQYLAAGGFNVVNINYSLCPEAGLGTIVNEIAAAMDWAHAHAEEYGFDTRRVFLTGDSAGGHMVMLAAAVFRGGPSAEYFHVRRPAIDVAACGVSCPEASFEWRLLPRNLTATALYLILHKYTFDRDCCRYSSYDTYMDEGYPPLWIGTSPEDSLLYTHTRRLPAYMRDRGLTCEYREYHGREHRLEHVFNVLYPDWPESRQANDDMLAFFRSLL